MVRGLHNLILLIVNKIDLASYVEVDLDRMEKDCKRLRNEKPTAFTNVKKGIGVLEIADWIEKEYRVAWK